VVQDKPPLLPPPPREGYLRAIGPKTVHAERTLYFVPPREYEAGKAADKVTKKRLGQEYGWSQDRKPKGRRLPGKSTLVINSVDFEQKRSVYCPCDGGCYEENMPPGPHCIPMPM
jgi:hypothetical protein